MKGRLDFLLKKKVSQDLQDLQDSHPLAVPQVSKTSQNLQISQYTQSLSDTGFFATAYGAKKKEAIQQQQTLTRHSTDTAQEVSTGASPQVKPYVKVFHMDETDESESESDDSEDEVTESKESISNLLKNRDKFYTPPIERRNNEFEYRLATSEPIPIVQRNTPNGKRN